MQTDLPEPVAPAISRCGMRARSATIGLAGRRSGRARSSVCSSTTASGTAVLWTTLRSVTSDSVVFGDFDAEHRLAGHRRFDADRRRGERERQVVRERRDLLDADARAGDFFGARLRLAVLVEDRLVVLVALHDRARLDVPARLDAELRDGRAFVDLHDLRVDAEARERLFDQRGADRAVGACRSRRAAFSASTSIAGSCQPSRDRRLPFASTVTPVSLRPPSACGSSLGEQHRLYGALVLDVLLFGRSRRRTSAPTSRSRAAPSRSPWAPAASGR